MASNKDIIKSFTIKVNTKNGKVKIDGVTKSFQDAETAYKKMNNSMQNTSGMDKAAKAASGVSAASGGAAASVTEFGRVISDAPYGIRGVANNLSQLASNLALTAKKAGGFSAAMTQLGKAFIGPLGILVAIQAALALLEAWSMRAKEANVAAEVFGKSITENAAKLDILVMALNDTNLTTEQQISIMQENKEGLEELGFEVGNTEEAMIRLKEAMEAEIVTMKKRAIAQGFANVIQEQSNKIAEMVALGVEGNVKWYEELAIALRTGGAAFAGMSREQVKNVIVGQKIFEMNKLIEGSYNQLTKVLEDGDMYINYLMDGGKKKGAGKRARALKIFKQQFLDLERLILQNEKQLTLLSTRNEIERLEIQKDFADQEVEMKRDQFVEKQKIRLAEYLESIKGHAKEGELRVEATRKFNESLAEAEIELGEAKLAISNNYAKKIALKEGEIRRALAKQEADLFIDIMQSQRAGIDPEALMTDDFLRAEDSARGQKLSQLTGELAAAQEGGNDIEIRNAQAELNAFNEELRQEDIQNELDYFNAKKGVQMEYVGFLKQTGTFLKAIAGDNESLQKAALITEKSAATADVVISAQKSIAQRTASNAALLPPLQAADAGFMAKDITRTKVSAALSIANIWATGWGKKNSVKDTGGSGGGQGGGRTFDFNLVGSTRENQLAQTTAGQLNQPVQAYVVSSQITTQQQLDSQIQSDATFGD